MTKVRIAVLAVPACAAVFLLSGCGDQAKYGSANITNFSPPPAAPSPSPSPSQAAPPPSPVQTHHQTPPPPAASTFTIYITSSTGTFGNVTVKAGTIVKWVNQDTVDRGVTSSTFNSGPIPPGGSYSYTFGHTGTYQYSDSTRPWVQGMVTVT